MEEEGTERVWRRTEIESNSAEQDLDSRLLVDLVYLFILIFFKYIDIHISALTEKISSLLKYCSLRY